MALTPEEKIKIEEEEKLRAEARKKYEKPAKKKMGSFKKFVAGTFALIVLIAVISAVSNSNTSTTTPATNSTPTQSDRETTSIVFAEKVIKDTLKAPSTAKFVDVKAYELTNEKDVWAINGFVDSQNSFGAVIRSQWEVQLDYRDGKGGTVKSILFDGKTL